ncbi:Maltose operon substrate-binding protein precursor (MalM) [Ectopseudomonas composti]|uniref:Maltose operon substrate-binding protein (MalM) n=1 Tax=Ectopseudomonas composti TaxID=658457 RepID=A0A1I5QJB0_9GAMM|nr:MalM family protein [Pseudomonas composti]SFP46130.1 Maltose operon substrate-binding protein precursor (MalM) [Pseudomonas composti]
MRSLLWLLMVLPLMQASASSRYLTWVDDLGRVHNTFVDSRFAEQQQQAQRRAAKSDQARLGDDGAWPGSAPSTGESKRRYFTWVDGSGQLQTSFYAGAQLAGASGRDQVLASGERAGDYIDSAVLEGRGFARNSYDSPYYTWVDEQGRMHNSPVPARSAEGQSGAGASTVRYSEGRQVEFERSKPSLPMLDGQPTAAMQALLEGSQARAESLYGELSTRCCGQMRDSDFSVLSAQEPRYEELDRFSPSFEFPMGRSYYAALKLPASRQSYGLRVRSFANRQVVYPSLLFLDEAKRPTRLVSDAVYQLHPETWYRYAFIEGTVQVRAERGERYVLLITTDEDRSLQTLDNKPFKRLLQALAVDEAGMQRHAHADEGAFELAIVR